MLDYFSKEKIVRIILLLLDNLLISENCIEIVGEIGGLELLAKLLNRHWVDTDIEEMLEKHHGIVEENYKVFTSIGKFKKEVTRGVFRWGPIHTERFWQENHMFFHEKEHLDLIKEMVHMLTEVNDSAKSVICYDLGEFAKYFPSGKQYLDNLKVKELVYEIMKQPNASPELKKEGITCLQKMLLSSWGGKEGTSMIK